MQCFFLGYASVANIMMQHNEKRQAEKKQIYQMSVGTLQARTVISLDFT